MSGRSTTRSAAFVLAFSAAALTPVRAHAQDTNRVGAATLLFDEGVRALDAGRLDEACAKLAKSQELAPSGGTLLALGECHERAGRTASAWIAFRGAAARAAAAGKSDAEASALEHATKLEPKLARLTIKSKGPTGEKVELLRDGNAVSTSELGVAVPVDPGTHEVNATAPGMRPWSKKVQVGPGAQATIEVPSLDGIPLGEEGSTEPDPGQTQRTLGIVAGGVGAGALVAGTIFGILASSDNSDGEKGCVDRRCTQAGFDSIQSASDKATIATIALIAGVALIAGGAVLYFTAPKPKQSAFDWSSGTYRW